MTVTPEQRETAREVERRISDLLALYLEKYKTADDAQKAEQTRAIVVYEIAAALAAERAKAIEEAANITAEAARKEFMHQVHGDGACRWMDLVTAAIRALIPAPPTEKDG